LKIEILSRLSLIKNPKLKTRDVKEGQEDISVETKGKDETEGIPALGIRKVSCHISHRKESVLEETRLQHQ